MVWVSMTQYNTLPPQSRWGEDLHDGSASLDLWGMQPEGGLEPGSHLDSVPALSASSQSA